MPEETSTTLTEKLRWMLKRAYKGTKKKPATSGKGVIMGLRGYKQEIRRLKK